MKKSLLSILLALALLLASVSVLAEADANFNKEGYPIVNEKVTLTALVGTDGDSPSDLNEITILKEAEEETNVHIDWIGVNEGTAFKDRKSLMLATDDLPDMFYCCVEDFELSKYGAEGAFIPMEDLIAEYAPRLSAILEARPDLRAYATAPDGHIYGVPKVSEGPWCAVNQIYGINVAWLEKLGLEMPTTVSELEKVLIAFRDEDPNGNGIKDEIPLSFAAGDSFSVGSFEYVFSALGLPISLDWTSSNIFDVKDGKVFCMATSDAFREGVETVARWYSEGLIDPESFIMNDSQWAAKLNAETTILGVVPCWDIADFIATPELLAQYDYLPPLRGEDGSDPVMCCPPMYGYFRGAGVITKACKNPEVAMRYIDYWYEPIKSYQSMEGKIGERLFEQPDGSLQLSSGDTTQVGAMEWARGASCLQVHGIWYVDAKQYTTELRLPSTDKKVAHIMSKILPFADPDPWLPVFYTPEESDAISIKMTDVKSLVNRKAGEWILNGITEEEWNGMLAELDKIGLNDMLSVMQGAYDRMQA